jgi:hypothetical protein
VTEPTNAELAATAQATIRDQEAALDARLENLVIRALAYAIEGKHVPVALLSAIDTLERQMAGLATVLARAVPDAESAPTEEG